MSIAALFNRKVHTTMDVARVEGGKKPAEALILESARTLLSSKNDEPVSISEVEGGFVVQGNAAAVLFADTGDVEVKALPEGKVKPEPKVKPEAKSATAFDSTAFRKLAESNKTIGFLVKKHTDESTWPSLFETYVKGDADMEKAYSKFSAPQVVEKIDPSAPGAAILAIKNAVQAAHDRIQAGINEGVLSEEALVEYMQVSPLVPYEKPLKADDARISIGGSSIYLCNDDFFAKVPHYAVADYLLGLAIKDAVDGGKLDGFVKAVRSFLSTSEKAKALDVELVESLVESLDEAMKPSHPTVVPFKKGSKVTWTAPDGTDETGSVVSDVAEQHKVKVLPAGNGREAVLVARKSLSLSEATDTPETVVLVIGDEAVELHAEDEDGELLATAAYNLNDSASLETAKAEVLSTAEDLGYDVTNAEDVTEAAKPKKGKKKASTGTSYGSAQNNGQDDDGDGLGDDEEELDETGNAVEVDAKKKSTYPNTGLSHQSRGSTGAGSDDDGKELDADNYYDTSEALVAAVLADPALFEHAEYVAIASALDARDQKAVTEALKAVTHPRLTLVAEGFTSRKHVRGRKPTGKTLPRKAKFKKKPGSNMPHAPVDVGPGKPKSTTGSVKESWIKEARRMSVTEFAAHMLESANSDSVETFAAKVHALGEDYATGDKRDIGRKVTAVNPIIKKRTGRGLNLEEVAKTPPVETVMLVCSASDLDAGLSNRLTEAGIPATAEVRIVGESVHIRVPKTLADKLTAEFPQAKLA